jgi:hypothetical protein
LANIAVADSDEELNGLKSGKDIDLYEDDETTTTTTFAMIDDNKDDDEQQRTTAPPIDNAAEADRKVKQSAILEVIIFISVLMYVTKTFEIFCRCCHQAFKFAWGQYEKHAFGSDEITPVGGRAVNDWGGLGTKTSCLLRVVKLFF